MSYLNNYNNNTVILEEKPVYNENLNEEEKQFIDNNSYISSNNDNSEINNLLLKFHTFVNCIYALGCIFTIIQGIGIILYFEFYNIIIGLYIILFGIITLTYDIKEFNKYYNNNFNFLNNLLGRSITILYFAILSYSTSFNHFWNIFIMIYNIVISCLYFMLYIIVIFKIFQYDDLSDIYNGI